jgi:hypothetical protein
VNYNSASKDITIIVEMATPVITWSNPANIPYGTALSDTQLDATADVAGSFKYTPDIGAVLNVGSQTLHVDFTPTDTVNYNSASKDITIIVEKVSTTTTLSSSANPSVYGQPVTFTATVIPSTATGTVTFRSKGDTLGTATLSGGNAKFTTSSLPAGTNPVQAVYEGDSRFDGSNSPALVQKVNTASTKAAVSSSSNPSTSGKPVTFRAAVSVTAPGAGTPTGTVQFFDGKSSLGTAPVLAPATSASAISAPALSVSTITVSTLSAGAHTITAVYNGDSNFGTSTSPALTQTVNKGSCGSLSTSLSVAKATVKSGDTVTFKATTTGTYTTWDFDFGDGTPHLSTPAPSILHKYSLPKGKTSMTYTAVMKASNGCSTTQSSVSIKVTQ